MSLFKNFNLNKLKEGLSKTREKIVNSISETVTGKAVIDDMTIDRIEEILLGSDIGFDTSEKIIESLKRNLKSEKDRSGEKIIEIVKQELTNVLSISKSNGKDQSLAKPYVILIVGVNGVGKTTTIGKLANNYKMIGKKVIVGAADTFRAAANEQLEIWAKRADVDIIQSTKGADPSAVVFETIKKAIDNDYDIVLIDTAGRLHNKANLMTELDKIRRVMKKLLPDAPHETLLIVDGNTGQNALVQAEEFSKVADLTGLVITKLDGTAKGGVVFQIVAKQNVPIKFIGVGEGIDDLLEFNSSAFVDAIFN
ncbi:MAG: signal recognition particle-docking protein FtsY [Ignavibacteriaceae bacterium]|nr:signal recognition particle-docking protein FtsY [Ignavibacterium sp.]MCC6255129.1 signal recognition particle-docking protein FtsY [Ignavibacteriaceae bacterium]HMN25872.1 signal recognition particle-docking protein FtsY [Ignavibacteriaceae bacterium]HRN25082.1 signal recognition particle-docking protein FtsY [Ignavibacteriaceae bacterium]HRP94404.1 signal recognition particle-docking protein FtsY [Ignavibacteriaceae bacterium]